MPNKAQWNGQTGIVANSDFVSGIRFCWGGIFLIWRRRRKLQGFFSFWVEWASLPTQTEEAASSKSSKVKVKVSLAQKAPEIVNVEVIWFSVPYMKSMMVVALCHLNQLLLLIHSMPSAVLKWWEWDLRKNSRVTSSEGWWSGPWCPPLHSHLSKEGLLSIGCL